MGLTLSAPAPALDGPTLGRYHLTVAGAGTTALPLDGDYVERLCRDEDGCDVLLSMQSTDSAWLKVRRTRLFLSTQEISPGQQVWATTNETNALGSDAVDNDDIESVALTVPDAGGACELGDADGLFREDLAVGFWLRLVGGSPTFVCDLVISD